MTILKSLEDKHLNKNKIESNKPNQEGERPLQWRLLALKKEDSSS